MKLIQIIVDKILELNDRYGSNLALGYNKYYGNMGILHNAVIGMFNSLGPHTKPSGDICTIAGDEALIYNCGSIQCPDPESMSKAKVIILWGVNPAVSAVQQYRFINNAKEHGATIIVIDPLFTATAAKADLYLQIKPDTTHCWL
jgi:anaerobic selenocysteine-containing dehydrogenase